MKKFRVRRIAQVMALGCCVVFLAAGAVSAQNDQQDMTVLPSSQMEDKSTDITGCDVDYSQANDGEAAPANELSEVENGVYTFDDWEEAEATLGLSMGKPQNMLQEKWLLSGMVDNDKRCVYAVTNCEDGKLEIYDSDFGSKEWSFSQSLQDAYRVVQLKFYGVSENKIKETLDAVNFKEYRREK